MRGPRGAFVRMAGPPRAVGRYLFRTREIRVGRPIRRPFCRLGGAKPATYSPADSSVRAHGDCAIFLRLVARRDRRHAADDLATRPFGRSGQVRQPLLSIEKRRAALGHLQWHGRSLAGTAGMAWLDASHGAQSTDAGPAKAQGLGKRPSAEYEGPPRRAAAAGQSRRIGYPPAGNGRLRGLVARLTP